LIVWVTGRAEPPTGSAWNRSGTIPMVIIRAGIVSRSVV
jgi:hypothetical protein